MKIVALVNFSGVFAMTTGEVRDVDDSVNVQDLLRAGYVAEVKDNLDKKGVKADESKRNNSK